MIFPRLPQSFLKKPKGLKLPDAKKMRKELLSVGEQVAEEFMDTVKSNIETNKYGYSLKQETIKRKGSNIPLVDSGQLLDAIYREGTKVSVNDEVREDSPLTNKQLAIVHEYGIKDRGVPPRPVWRSTWKDYREEATSKVRESLKRKK
jgi:hypothetical protein